MRVLSVVCVLFLSPLISAVEAKQILPGPFPFELVEVIDGDTFRARVDIWLGQSVTVKVRLKGVDTPEMNGKCAAEKKLARQAKDFAENWLKKTKYNWSMSITALMRGACWPRRKSKTVTACRPRFWLKISPSLIAGGAPNGALNQSARFWRPAPQARFCLLSIRSSTTAGSANVEVSPRLEKSSSAIFLRMRRMILPERVFGRPGAN